MTRRTPCLLIAGTQSGSGKTTLAVGLAAALRRRGLRVQTYKVGPDYLDPTWLTAASGRPCYNLDGWMQGREYVTHLFERTSADADIAVIEGVMGLFDGASADADSGSAAEIGRWLDADVLLTVPAAGAARSFAAIVLGFCRFDERLRIVGVVASKTASVKHEGILREALQAAKLPPLVGAMHTGECPVLPSRHLGLVGAGCDRADIPSLVSQLGEAIERCCDIDRMLQLPKARRRSESDVCIGESGVCATGERRCVAAAYDEAFHFYYPDVFDELERQGCDIYFFSPLRNQRLPDNADALLLGGGYPEEHAATLAANTATAESIRRFHERGYPIYAECGGLIYLSQAIVDRHGRRHAMLGILPVETRMLPRRKRLGYVETTLTADTFWGRAGDCLRGHEFHYAELTADPSKSPGWQAVYRRRFRDGETSEPEGFWYRERNTLASFVHLHVAAAPGAIERFVAWLKACGRSCAPVTRKTNGDHRPAAWRTRWMELPGKNVDARSDPE
ncbi:cobyrinate a,c-diamide synthase [Thermostilla marina]